MKKNGTRILVLLMALLFSVGAGAQRLYYIYLQMESGAPFLVKMNDKIYNAAPTGYLILSGLRDSTYHITIGTGSDQADHAFTCTINGKDHGYLVKDLKNQGWALFDLQSLKLVMEISGSQSGGLSYVPRKQVSPFTALLARATGDPTLLQTPVLVKAKKEQPVKDLAAAPVQKPAENSAAVPPATHPPVGAASEGKPQTSAPEEKLVVEKKAEQVVDSAVRKPAVAVVITPPKDTVTLVRADKKVTEPVATEKKVDRVVDSAVGKPAVAAAMTPPKDTVTVAAAEKKVEEPADTKKQTTATSQADAARVIATDATVGKLVDRAVTKKEETYPLSKISIKSESSTTEGVGLIFIDRWESSADTVRILIPNTPRPALVKKQPAAAEPQRKFLDFDSSAAPPEKATALVQKQPTAAEPQRKFLDFDSNSTLPEKNTAQEIAEQVNKAAVTEDAKQPQLPKTDTLAVAPATCPRQATQEDFFALRETMAAAREDARMLDLAEQYFRRACFSTEQLKNLGVLFLKDSWRYRFFASAYAHVSDPVNFPVLRRQLTDDYYASRFDAMLQF